MKKSTITLSQQNIKLKNRPIPNAKAGNKATKATRVAAIFLSCLILLRSVCFLFDEELITDIEPRFI